MNAEIKNNESGQSINDELTYWQKQLILYTKGHYGPMRFIFDDLSSFAAELFDLPVDEVTQQNVNAMIEITIDTLLKHGVVKSTIWRDMTHQLIRDNHTVDLDNTSRYISYMLASMQGIHVVNHNLALGTVSAPMYQRINDRRIP